jgi:transcription-repair coupling factor (superfamily II helicase)
MDDFGSGEIDILICTTIVEMGLDIPNANTMIIEDSHKLGLAQLHQLRGRIGRSNKQGYCYFLIPDAVIPKLASERLESIVRLSKLGSGYFIAQEDMELRGSGEILGDKQSGHIASIGLSLYLSMLKSAIKIKKNDTNKEIIKTDVNFFDSAFISDIYMPSTVERLKIYKLIYDADSHKDIQKIKLFLEDTCGRIPHETSNLLKNATINQLIADLRMPKLTSSTEITSILLSEAVSDETILRLLELIKTDQSIYSFDNKNRFNIKLIEQNGSLRRDKIINILNDLF